MKKFSKIAVVLLMLVSVIVALTACNAVSEVTIEKDNMPQLVFVQGQELDLSGGVLTVKYSEETEQVALDSSEVEISGYDKDRLGDQELTISYKGKSTQLTVSVVTRMVAIGAEKDYFIGEPFKNNKGSLKITRDDGTSFSVQLNDEDLIIEGFDSSKAGTVSVTARYQDYVGAFDVNIFEVESAALTAPEQSFYDSHDEGINLSGGYLTVKGDGGALTRNVTLTESMISGFDLSAATIENATTPLEQKVTVNYAGQEYGEFKVYITYSNVSIIKDVAEDLTEKLASIDWTAEEIQIPSTQGEDALEAMNKYFALPVEEKALFTDAEKEILTRTASVYGVAKYNTDIKEYENTLVVLDGVLYLTCGAGEEGYEKTKADLAKLQSEEAPSFVSVAGILTEIASEFAEITLGEATLADYLIGIYDPQSFNGVVLEIEHMVALYEKLASVPADWTRENLSNYAGDIDAALELITMSKYTGLSYMPMYNIVSAWREKSDFFEIMYWYYYDTLNVEAIYALQDVYLPGAIADLYNYITEAWNQMYYITQGYSYDATLFMLYYNNAVQIANNIIRGDNELYYVLYYVIGLDGFSSSGLVSFGAVLEHLRTSTNSYSFIYGQGAMLGVAEFANVWQGYIDIINNLLNNESYRESEQYGNDVELLLKSFVELSPAQQYSFITSLHPFYNNGVPEYALSYSEEGAYSLFVSLIAGYYQNILPATTHSVFRGLLNALEIYSIAADQTEFVKAMDTVKADYAKLSNADKVEFDKYLGYFYEKYSVAYEYTQKTEEPELGEWAETFEQLEIAITRIDAGYYMMNYYQLDCFSLIYSAYESAQLLIDQILASDNETVINTYYYGQHTFNLSGQEIVWTFDYAVLYARSIYVYGLTDNTIGSYMLWDAYTTTLRSFMAEIVEVMWGSSATLDVNTVLEAMAFFRELSSLDQLVFYSVDAANGWYYRSLSSFFGTYFIEYKEVEGSEEPEAVVNENAAAAISALFTVEKAYVNYRYLVSLEDAEADAAAALETFNTMLILFNEAYAKLTDEQKATFDKYLAETVKYYQDKYAEVISSATPAE